MSASKGQFMTRINEERFKKVDEMLRTTQSQFLSNGFDAPFTAFVDWETWRAIEGHVKRLGGYGDGVISENEITVIKYSDWKIYWLRNDDKDKIRILMFPCQGVYCNIK